MRKPQRPTRPSSRPPEVAPKAQRPRPTSEPSSSIKTIPAAISTARAVREQRDVNREALQRSSQRFAERARLRRRLSLRKYLIAFAALFGVLVGVWSVFFSNFFDLKPADIEIVGTSEFVSETDVLDVVASHTGTPLARLDLNEIGNEITQVRGVSSAIVRREWPNGVRVSLSERTPVAAVKSGENFVLLDADGVRVGESDEVPDDLALAQVPLSEGRQSSLAAVLTVLDEIPIELRDEIVDIGADTRDTVYFTLEDGARVEWGSSDDSLLKASVLEVLRSQEAKIYDVSAPSLPVTRD